MRPPAALALLLSAAWLTACAAGTGPSPTAASPSGAAGAGAPAAAPAAPSSVPAAAPTSDAQVVELTVRGGSVSGATGRVPVRLGADVVLQVTSDVADELHLHGYDEKTDLVPGTPAELRFTADVPGTFEVELEQAGRTLTRLQVR